MLVLGIESSCDDTSVALVDCTDQGHVVVAESTISQIDVHKKYGGVVPEVAGRLHAEKIVPLIEAVLANTPLPPSRGDWRPEAIAVTAGPGLITGLLVGVEAARTLSYAWNIPLVATNHIAGHIHSVELTAAADKLIQFPALCLVVSGGHTELVLMQSHTEYKILGSTVDDAAGECFDKVAKLLGLPYPGGPEISKLGATGRTDAIRFPRPMLDKDNYQFSFSGLKTSALYWLRDNTPPPPSRGDLAVPPLEGGSRGVLANDITTNDFCASFETAIVDVLVGKTVRAAVQYQPKSVLLCGGVAANKKLREALSAAVLATTGSPLLTPLPRYCMDNGAMIAVAGYYHAKEKQFADWQTISANPNWKIA